MMIRKVLLLLVTLSFVALLGCDDSGDSRYPWDKSNDGGTGEVTDDSGSTAATDGGDTTYNVDGLSDDSCDGCPDQLSETEEDQLNEELSKNGILNAKILLNVRVTVPQTENPHSDGDLDLWATAILPAGGEKLPTIVVATPYRREMMMMLYIPLVAKGYNLLTVDIRGTGSSAGKWTSFDLVEQYDIKYVVDGFIPDQIWSDGRVGMIGPSYMGIIQMLTAGLVDRDEATGEPVHLKAIFPLVPMADTYRDIVMHGGNCDLLFIPLWLGIVDILGILPSTVMLGEDGVPTEEDIQEAQDIWLEHANHLLTTIGWIMDADHINDGPFYDQKSTMIYWPDKPEGGWGFYEGDNYTIPSNLPVFSVGGWFDIFTRGTTNIYQHGLKNHTDSNKSMIIGEWYHLGGAMGMGLNSILTCSLPARWFDWKIKGKEDAFMEEFPVLLYVMGEKKWRAEKSWPLPASRVDAMTMYLTKQAPSPIEGDWYTDEPWWRIIKYYTDNNFSLSWGPDASGENPVLKHNPLDLHGLISRASTRWLMGIPALVSQVSKNFLGVNIDPSMPFEDERSDEKECLTFTSEPLDVDLEIVGPLKVTFWAKTKFADPLTQLLIDQTIGLIKDAVNVDSNLILDSASKNDVQWVAELTDVFPDGRARNITSGWLSAWHRQYDPTGATNVYYEGPWYDRTKIVEHALDPEYQAFDPFYDGPDVEPQPITEGEYYQYAIELWPTCNVFKEGHRIRLSLSASDFPHLLPILKPSENTIIIDDRHQATLDFTTSNSDNEDDTWKWIGSNKDADEYLLSGASPSCGTPASASAWGGRNGTLLSGIMGVLFMMLFPLFVILVHRRFRRRTLL